MMTAAEQLAAFEAKRKGLSFRLWPREDILEHTRLLRIAIDETPPRLMPGQRAEPEQWRGWQGDKLPLDAEIERTFSKPNQQANT